MVRLKYLTRVNRWTDLGRPPVATLEQATSGQLSVSPVWRGLLCRYGVCDVASTVFRDRHGCWGFLDLWRTDASAFTAAEIDFLAGIAPEVTDGLRRSVARAFRRAGGRARADGSARADEALVVLLSPDLRIQGQTPAADRQMRALLPPPGDGPPVPAIAYNVAAQLLAVEQGVDGHAPSARVSVGGGRWLTARAARLNGGRAAVRAADRRGPGAEHDP